MTADMKLDMAVCEAVGLERVSADGCFLPSEDLNAAFAAAEKVGLLRECYLHQDTYWHVWGRPTSELGTAFNVRGDTPALAICAAILKLKESKDANKV